MSDVLPNGLWEIVQPLLPPAPRTGRARVDQRAVLTTVLFVQASGCSWEKAELPPGAGGQGGQEPVPSVAAH
ncbi:transposase [Nocardiopsis dassonvillei]